MGRRDGKREGKNNPPPPPPPSSFCHSPKRDGRNIAEQPSGALSLFFPPAPARLPAPSSSQPHPRPRPAPGPLPAAQSVRRGRRSGSIKRRRARPPGAERGSPAPSPCPQPSPGNSTALGWGGGRGRTDGGTPGVRRAQQRGYPSRSPRGRFLLSPRDGGRRGKEDKGRLLFCLQNKLSAVPPTFFFFFSLIFSFVSFFHFFLFPCEALTLFP